MKLIATSMLCMLTNMLFSQNANKIAIQAIKKAIGSDLKGYTVYSSPTDNFGVGTSCHNKWTPQGVMLTDMIDAYELNRGDQTSNKWKSVNNYAYYGVGEGLTLDDSAQSFYGIGLLLPKLLKVFNISVSASASKSKSIKLVIDSAVKRHLNFNNFLTYVQSDKNHALTKSWQRRKLRLVTSDYVLLSYRLDVEPTDSIGVDLAAKLDSVVNNSSKIFSGGDSLGVTVRKESAGKFSISSIRPVVFAVYIQKRKQMGYQSAEKSFADLEVVTDQELAATELDPAVFRKASL